MQNLYIGTKPRKTGMMPGSLVFTGKRKMKNVSLEAFCYNQEEVRRIPLRSADEIPGLLQAAQISIARTLIGTACTVLLAGFLGYMFTRETMWKRKLWYRFVVLTMYFNAGIIPKFAFIG